MIELTLKLEDITDKNFMVVRVNLMFLGYKLLNTSVALNMDMKEATFVKSIDLIQFIANRAKPDEFSY